MQQGRPERAEQLRLHLRRVRAELAARRVRVHGQRQVAQHAERNVFTCWVGGSAMLEAQRIAAAHGVLSHDSPEKAIAIFSGIDQIKEGGEGATQA